MCARSKRPHHSYASPDLDSHFHLGTPIYARLDNESKGSLGRKRQRPGLVSYASEDWVTSSLGFNLDIDEASTPGTTMDCYDIADREITQTLTVIPYEQALPASEAEFPRHGIYPEPLGLADEHIKIQITGQDLLYHHGWRSDRGLGPKVKRPRSMDDETPGLSTTDARVDQYLFQSADSKLPSNWLHQSSGLAYRNSMAKGTLLTNPRGTAKGDSRNRDSCHLLVHSSILSSQTPDGTDAPPGEDVLVLTQLLASRRHDCSRAVRSQSCANRPNCNAHSYGPVTSFPSFPLDQLPGFIGVVRDLEEAHISPSRSFLRTMIKKGHATRPKTYASTLQSGPSAEARSSVHVKHGQQESCGNTWLTSHSLRTFSSPISHRFTSSMAQNIYLPRLTSDSSLPAFSSDARINLTFEPSPLLRSRLNI